MRVEYSANNSGGHWWLSDDNWVALEKAGWFVIWGGSYFCNSEFNWNSKPAGHIPCSRGDHCPGHRRFESLEECRAAVDGPFLGAAAKYASKDFPSMGEGIKEWEKVLGMDASDEGCSCCGPPHTFHSDEGFCSGQEIISFLYNTPYSYRELAAKLAETQDD